MRVIYEPQGGEPQTFDYKPTELLSIESEAIEDVGGPTWGSYSEFGDKLGSGNLKARRALLWIFLRRQNPRLRFVDLVVRVDEVKLAADADDLKVYLEQDTLTAEERAEAEAELVGLGGVVPVGKDVPDDSATDSPSPQPDSEPSPSNAAGT